MKAGEQKATKLVLLYFKLPEIFKEMQFLSQSLLEWRLLILTSFWNEKNKHIYYVL